MIRGGGGGSPRSGAHVGCSAGRAAGQCGDVLGKFVGGWRLTHPAERAAGRTRGRSFSSMSRVRRGAVRRHVGSGGNDGHRQIVGERASGGGLKANTCATAWQQHSPRERLGRERRPPPPPPPPHQHRRLCGSRGGGGSERAQIARRAGRRRSGGKAETGRLRASWRECCAGAAQTSAAQRVGAVRVTGGDHAS
jgi:hypothetical protein